MGSLEALSTPLTSVFCWQVRGEWLIGPLDIIIDYRGQNSITRVRTGLQAVQFDTLTTIDKYGAEMSDFRLIR